MGWFCAYAYACVALYVNNKAINPEKADSRHAPVRPQYRWDEITEGIPVP